MLDLSGAMPRSRRRVQFVPRRSTMTLAPVGPQTTSAPPSGETAGWDLPTLATTLADEFRGRGAALAAMARAQQALARGCASTALAVNMHHFQVGFVADTWRRTAAPPSEQLLRRIAA